MEIAAFRADVLKMNPFTKWNAEYRAGPRWKWELYRAVWRVAAGVWIIVAVLGFLALLKVLRQ